MSYPFSLEAIFAIAQNDAIGLKGSLPWHLRTELQLFKSITMHHALIMGRRTFDSLPGHLPHREHIVISSSMKEMQGIHIARSIAEALSIAEHLHREKVFVIGGKTIFEALIPHCTCIHVSRIMGEFEADLFYDINLSGKMIQQSHSLRDKETGIDILYQKILI